MSQIRFDASTVARAVRRNQSPYWGEHAARYRFAAPYVQNSCVLDVACGSGYGLPVLRERARLVVGSDIDIGAARKARAEMGHQSGSIVVSDGCKLPFVDDSFDVVTSFETIEHLETRVQFLSELRRVLNPGGLCIISTPNAIHTQPVNGKPRNPYHVFEYTPDEFVAELGRHFKEVELYGQSLSSRFAISPFWDDQEKLPRGVGMQSRLFFWRALNRLPIFSIRDFVSGLLWGHTFYPGDEDYEFQTEKLDGAPVLVALCRGTNSLR